LQWLAQDLATARAQVLGERTLADLLATDAADESQAASAAP
jgi:hypothetical protein